MSNPVLLNPDLFKMAPEDMKVYPCDKCNNYKPQWVYWDRVGNPDGDPELCCSYCALYMTQWGKDAADDINGM